MIDPGKVALFVPSGLSRFKSNLFERVGAEIGRVVRDDPALLAKLPDDIVPIVGCTAALRPYIQEWQRTGRTFVFWDRGYIRRVFATWLPKGESGGYYRWTVNHFQMQSIRDVPDDRWRALKVETAPWRQGRPGDGRKIVIASTSMPHLNYWKLVGAENWIAETAAYLKTITDRPIVVRDKESKLPLQDELADAHMLVAHGSIAAVEAVIMGCPVCVHPSSAASLVGIADLAAIEYPVFPERQPWLNSLAYCQFNESELTDGTLWRLME